MFHKMIRRLYICAISVLAVILTVTCVIRISNMKSKHGELADKRVDSIAEEGDEPYYHYMTDDGEYAMRIGDIYSGIEMSNSTSEIIGMSYTEMTIEGDEVYAITWVDNVQMLFPDEQIVVREDGMIVREDGSVVDPDSFVQNTSGLYRARKEHLRRCSFREALEAFDYTYSLADSKDKIIRCSVQSNAILDEDVIHERSEKIIREGSRTGWIGQIRYGVYEREGYKVIYFENCAMIREWIREDTRSLILTSGIQFLVISVLLAVILFLFEKPINNSVKKQQAFIVEAGKELEPSFQKLKTNLDILDRENGPSEWIDDMRIESDNLEVLVGRLVELGKLESATDMRRKKGNGQADQSTHLSICLKKTVAEYAKTAKACGLNLDLEIAKDVFCRGDEESIRKVLRALLDNALKYCDEDGKIIVVLADDCRSRMCEITMVNSYKNVDKMQFDKLFERFYRESRARTAGKSFGIGLSMAKSICEQNGGRISAYKACDGMIGFQVLLPRIIPSGKYGN